MAAARLLSFNKVFTAKTWTLVSSDFISFFTVLIASRVPRSCYRYTSSGARIVEKELRLPQPTAALTSRAPAVRQSEGKNPEGLCGFLD